MTGTLLYKCVVLSDIIFAVLPININFNSQLPYLNAKFGYFGLNPLFFSDSLSDFLRVFTTLIEFIYLKFDMYPFIPLTLL